MAKTVNRMTHLPSRRTVLGYLSSGTLLAAARSLMPRSSAFGAGGATQETLLSLWEHSAKVDITPVVKALGFNTVWTHDRPYDGKFTLEDTLMYRHLQVPGIKYVIAKIERGIWGWSFDQAMTHAEWIANLARNHKEIIGLYMNDLYVDTYNVAKGGHSPDQFRQIIAKVRSVNPQLAIFVPVYPTRESSEPFDFDYDALIFNIHFDTLKRELLRTSENHLIEAERKFPGKPIMTGLYFNSGPEKRPLSEEEFNYLMEIYVRHINEGRTVGLRIFRAQDFLDRPIYVEWAKAALAKLKRR